MCAIRPTQATLIDPRSEFPVALLEFLLEPNGDSLSDYRIKYAGLITEMVLDDSRFDSTLNDHCKDQISIGVKAKDVGIYRLVHLGMRKLPISHFWTALAGALRRCVAFVWPAKRHSTRLV